MTLPEALQPPDKMVALRLTLAIDDLAVRMREQLHGDSGAPTNRIVWHQRGARLLIHVESLTVRAVDGWLLCNLDAQTDEVGRETLQFIFFLGRKADAGPHGAATINAPTHGAAQIADRWGPDLLRVLWEAILDGLEAALDAASIQFANRRVAVAGFFATDAMLVIDIVAGDA